MTAETPAIKVLEDARKAQAELERVKARTADAIRDGERASRELQSAVGGVDEIDKALEVLREDHRARLRGAEVE